IGDVDGEALFGEALDFRRGAAYAGGIHLVGALRELGYALHLRGLHGSDGDFQLERRKEIFEAERAAGGAGALRALGVHFTAAAIFVGDARAVEGPYVRQEGWNLRGAR